MIKRLFGVSCILCFILLSPQFAQAGELSLSINGQWQSSRDSEIVGGRTYVPLRVVSEGLNYDVEWYAHSRLVEIDHPGQTGRAGAIAPSGRIQLMVQGEMIESNSELGLPFLKNGRTMVPLRLVAEHLGADIEWDNARRCVHIMQGVVARELGMDPPTAMSQGTKSLAQTNQQERAETLTIRGDAILPLEDIEAYLAHQEELIYQLAMREGKRFVPFPMDIAKLYVEIGERYQIRGDVALAQAIHETGFFQYGREVLPSQNNYCGLGAIGRKTSFEDLQAQSFSLVDPARAWLSLDSHGWWFDNPAIGVEAHIQHLYSYATTEPLPSGCVLVDGRFRHGHRGKAISWQDLNGKWAVPGDGYGERIVEGIWQAMCEF